MKSFTVFQLNIYIIYMKVLIQAYSHPISLSISLSRFNSWCSCVCFTKVETVNTNTTNIRWNKVSLFFHLFVVVCSGTVWWCFCDKKFVIFIFLRAIRRVLSLSVCMKMWMRARMCSSSYVCVPLCKKLNVNLYAWHDNVCPKCIAAFKFYRKPEYKTDNFISSTTGMIHWNHITQNEYRFDTRWHRC